MQIKIPNTKNSKRTPREPHSFIPATHNFHYLIIGILTIAALWAFSKGTAAQDASQFLTPPYYGTQRVTSVFDHEYPIYNQESVTVTGSVTTTME